MFEEDSKNPPDFSQIYGEPDPDEDTLDKFTMEDNEHIKEFESKLKEIISNSKKVSFKEDQVKDCNCDKCQDAKCFVDDDNKQKELEV
jgi:hypothetical protein